MIMSPNPSFLLDTGGGMYVAMALTRRPNAILTGTRTHTREGGRQALKHHHPRRHSLGWFSAKAPTLTPEDSTHSQFSCVCRLLLCTGGFLCSQNGSGLVVCSKGHFHAKKSDLRRTELQIYKFNPRPQVQGPQGLSCIWSSCRPCLQRCDEPSGNHVRSLGP